MKTDRPANADEQPEPSDDRSAILQLEESVTQAAVFLEQLVNGLDARTDGKTKQKRKASAFVASLSDAVYNCQQELLARFEAACEENRQLLDTINPSKNKLPPNGASSN